MSVEVMFVGRLGNNFFQYALGRIIAEHLEFEMTCRTFPIPPEHLALFSSEDTPSASLQSAANDFPQAALYIGGQRHWRPTQDFILGEGNWSGQSIDLAEVLANRSPRQIRLAGFFQRFEYYAPHLKKIREWFAVGRNNSKLDIFPRDVLVNVRGGKDFDRLGWTLDPAYYVNALESMNKLGRVYVCGIGIDSELRDALKPFNPLYIDGSPVEHFRLFQKFNRLIIPNSTFSWWGALLSSADVICVPDTSYLKGYSFSGSDVDLDVPESRYLKIRAQFCSSRVDKPPLPLAIEVPSGVAQYFKAPEPQA